VGADSTAGERPAPKRAAFSSISRAIADVMKREGLDERAALKAVARARGLSRSEAYRQWQSERSAEH
jgi:16S rRNA (cytidine1402-2'-O)-methyltransferase